MKGIIGRKLGMTQIFDEAGTVTPATIIEAGPCFVTQVRTPERDGYAAIQISFGEVASRKLTRGELGHLKKHNLPPSRVLRELRVKAEEVGEFTEGQRITVDVFQPGDLVDVTGTSKGRGYQGGVKRHGFRGGPKTHGQSDRQRAPGAIGSGTTPGRVYKGTRMAGHMGNARVTVQNLQVVRIYPEQNLIAVRGAVPGPQNGLLIIREARKE